MPNLNSFLDASRQYFVAPVVVDRRTGISIDEVKLLKHFENFVTVAAMAVIMGGTVSAFISAFIGA